ncbi:hypothetical protein D3C71_1658370 [compost metagenome]
MTVAPAQQRLRIGVQGVVEPVFGGEERGGQVRHAAGVFATGLRQRANVATRAECLGAVAAQQYADHPRVVGPGMQLFAEHFDHRQVQGVECLG